MGFVLPGGRNRASWLPSTCLWVSTIGPISIYQTVSEGLFSETQLPVLRSSRKLHCWAPVYRARTGSKGSPLSITCVIPSHRIAGKA